MGKTWFNVAKNWIILLQLDLKQIHKVNFYTRDNNFTQALLVCLWQISSLSQVAVGQRLAGQFKCQQSNQTLIFKRWSFDPPLQSALSAQRPNQSLVCNAWCPQSKQPNHSRLSSHLRQHFSDLARRPMLRWSSEPLIPIAVCAVCPIKAGQSETTSTFSCNTIHPTIKLLRVKYDMVSSARKIFHQNCYCVFHWCGNWFIIHTKLILVGDSDPRHGAQRLFNGGTHKVQRWCS